MYTGCTCHYCFEDTSTETISIKRGVRQGWSQSVLIFKIGITPILTEVHAILGSGIMIREKEYFKMSSLAYAHDLALMATYNE